MNRPELNPRADIETNMSHNHESYKRTQKWVMENSQNPYIGNVPPNINQKGPNPGNHQGRNSKPELVPYKPKFGYRIIY